MTDKYDKPVSGRFGTYDLSKLNTDLSVEALEEAARELAAKGERDPLWDDLPETYVDARIKYRGHPELWARWNKTYYRDQVASVVEILFAKGYVKPDIASAISAILYEKYGDILDPDDPAFFDTDASLIADGLIERGYLIK